MELLNLANGFFGPRLLADVTLTVEILFYLILSAGVVAQLLGRFKIHAWLQTPVVILNIFFVVLVMIPTFRELSRSASIQLIQVPVLVTAVHAMLGIVAQLLSVYCLLAGLKILPRRIGVLRYWMWGAYTAWTVTIVFGIGVYIFYYVVSSPPPVSAGFTSEYLERIEDDISLSTR
jgi:hypothetical protein